MVLLVAVALSACTSGRRAQDLPCPVTEPNGSTPPGEQPSVLHHGDGRLWTAFWPDGTVVFSPGGPGEIRADGSLAMKFPWWRGSDVQGPLEITGRRLDGEAPPAYGEIPSGYGETGFQATSIVFPSQGCWEVTGSVADDELIFVQQAVRVEG
jgi:hypothetical protein